MSHDTSQTLSKKAVPISVRLTNDEFDALRYSAGERSLSAYIRSRIFESSGGPNDAGQRISSQERQRLLSKLLVRLGSMDFDVRLSKLIECVETGAFENEQEILQVIKELSADLSKIRQDLLKGLGLRPRKEAS